MYIQQKYDFAKDLFTLSTHLARIFPRIQGQLLTNRHLFPNIPSSQPFVMR